MKSGMNYDFSEIPDGARIVLFPADANPIQKEPRKATFAGGYFHLDGSNPADGPDYYMGDVAAFCRGWLPVHDEVPA